MNSHSINIDFMEWNLALLFYCSNGLTYLKGNISSIHQKPIKLMSVYLVCFLWYEWILFDLFCRILWQCTGIKQSPNRNRIAHKKMVYFFKATICRILLFLWFTINFDSNFASFRNVLNEPLFLWGYPHFFAEKLRFSIYDSYSSFHK